MTVRSVLFVIVLMLLSACDQKQERRTLSDVAGGLNSGSSSSDSSRMRDGNIKSIHSLSIQEKEALDQLTLSIYKEIFGDSTACFIYETTYNFMPREDRSIGQKLSTPLVLLSGACVGHRMMMPVTMQMMEEMMYSRGVTWNDSRGREHKLEIASGFILPNPAGAGGSMGRSNDMSTIIPTQVRVR